MSQSFSLFQGRTAVLATMHRKETAIAPLLQQSLGLQIIVPEDFDTDRFGTFTREVKRSGDQLEAARQKAKAAIEQTGVSLAIASEGTFGPHPAMPFLPCNREIVVLIDPEQGLELVGQALSTETNFSHQRVSSLEEAEAFATKVGFPAHGLVVIANPNRDLAEIDKSQMRKGILTESQLQSAILWALEQAETVHLETDMRAMYNPTRMQVIAQATQDLIRLVGQTCPECNWPGFQAVEHQPGLPCELCGSPTPLTLNAIYRCQKCHFEKISQFPDGNRSADAAQCMYCNP
ncbi:MAG: hypothetical protein MUF49_22700 [Oculatellaceae cyanobacterium Prado106]|nr:hypothetical protein [Oculatellaceae cyanobacterium Prado106]